MAYEDLCMYCFENTGGESICPHCGRDSRAAVPQIQMLPGSLVYHDRFLVGRALGQDATGIVYAAFDTKRENRIRLREYLPRDCAQRLDDGSIVPIAGMEDKFERGLKKLRASVEGVEDPKKRHFFFEENGTAYIAQRKNAAESASSRDEDEDERGSGLKQVGVIVGVAAVVVLVAAIVIIRMVNGALNSAEDLTLAPSLSPSSTVSVWAPEETPTPTPYVSPTFAALVDPDLSWMDYTYSGNVEQEYQQQKDNVRVTASPTPNPNSSNKYKTVSSKSSTAEITALQQRLATLDWMSVGNITGKYDSATKQAVKDFQSYINSAMNPSEKLSVDGAAGPKTLMWLYAGDYTRPTATPTPAVTPDPDQQATVNKNSSKSDILAVQRKLIVLGLMPANAADGVYGSTTSAAVKKFQQRVNQLQGNDVLDVTGEVDPLSMAFLNYYVEEWEKLQQATATPTPTDIPDQPEEGSVNQSSPKESIQAVQQMLIQVGLMETGSDDGSYGSATVSAVAKFQEWVNGRLGKDELSVTGVADARTLGYLEYACDNNMYAAPTATPSIPTDTPFVPTDTPFVPTDAPTDAPTNAPEISLRLAVNGVEDSELVEITGNECKLKWMANAEVEGYTVDIVDSLGNRNARYDDVKNLSVDIPLDYLTPGEIYTVSVGARPIGGSDADIVWKSMRFTVPAQTTDAPTNTPIPVTGIRVKVNGEEDSWVSVSEDTISLKWLADGEVEGYSMSVMRPDGTEVGHINNTSDTEFSFSASEYHLVSGETYTVNISAQPKNGGEPVSVSVQFTYELPTTDAPTSAPVGTIDGVSIRVNDAEFGDFVDFSGDKVHFEWSASGDVESYSMRVEDSQGKEIGHYTDSDVTSVDVALSKFTPGETYTVYVGARPINGGDEDIVWTQMQFTVPPEATATPKPTVAPISAPQISIGSTAYSENGVPYLTGETAIFQWTADGDVQGYRARLVNASGDRHTLGDTESTSYTLTLSELAPGLYTIEVGAIPAYAQSEDDIVWTSYQFGIPETPQATDDPSATPEPVWPTQVDYQSSPEDIQLIQQKLYQLNMLSTENLVPGTLDELTLSAISSFQTRMNELYDANLPVIDPLDPLSVIDEMTLKALEMVTPELLNPEL